MKQLSFVILCLAFVMVRAQQTDSLIVHYYENYPFAYTENGKLKGIEVEIIEDYVQWMKQKKNTTVLVTYKAFKEFSAFYNSVKDGRDKVIGLGSVTNNPEREQEVAFSAPYLQNVAVLITDGRVPTVRNKGFAEVTAVLAGLNAYTIRRSSHEEYLSQLKKALLPAIPVIYVETQDAVLNAIATNPKSFGYVDIVAYWAYLKKNTNKYLKIQKAFNESQQYFAFILPKKSKYLDSVNEFFEGGFGFTSTKRYEQILEKYLGYEVLESVEIK